MKRLVRAFGRSLIGLLHPRMLWLSVKPFLIVALIWGLILWVSWEPFIELLRLHLSSISIFEPVKKILERIGQDDGMGLVAPFLASVIAVPLMIISLLLIISMTTVSGVVKHLSRQKIYVDLKKMHGGSFWGGMVLSLWTTLISLVLMVLSFPIWWIPPLFVVIPPIIWGWLTTRLMSYDVLAQHASFEERESLLKRFRWQLLIMGIISGAFSAIPGLFWISSSFMILLFPVVSLVMIWLYSLIFIFAALWFTHYLLQALKDMRQLKGDD